MGLETFLYGFIAEAASRDEADNTHMVAHNNGVLNALPEEDAFPPLHRSLFYANGHPNRDGLVGNYRGRTIAMSGRYKQPEEDIGEWLLKFEAMLQRLFWERATIHLKTELYGDFVFEWTAGPTSHDLQPRDIKTFEGPFRNWEDFSPAGIPEK